MLSSWARVSESDSIDFKLGDALEYTKKITSYHYTELVQSSYVSTANDLLNAQGVYSTLGAKWGRLIDRRRLKDRGVYSHNCKAQFRHQTFYEPNLIQIKANPNYLDGLNWFRRQS